MALFPGFPVPSHVASPEVLDPMLSFESDAGYVVRRVRTSRPRRRWQLEYLGQPVESVRIIRNFLYAMRHSVTAFQWYHPTGAERALFFPTTPVTVTLEHGMNTGMWVGISDTPNPSINGQVYPIFITAHNTFTLTGSVGAGIAGPGLAVVFVPKARAMMQDNTFAAPVTLIGPDRIPFAPDLMRGYYNFNLTIEEQL